MSEYLNSRNGNRNGNGNGRVKSYISPGPNLFSINELCSIVEIVSICVRCKAKNIHNMKHFVCKNCKKINIINTTKL